jgi:hypothetical protein
MSNHPTPLVKSFTPVTNQVDFCLAARHETDLVRAPGRPFSDDAVQTIGEETLVCTRIHDHVGHCCDEITGVAWSEHKILDACPQKFNHSKEKGLAA